MQEREVKFLGIDVADVERRLADIGAKMMGEYFQRWIVFDYADRRLDAERAWVRLRNEGDGKTTPSFKQRLGVKAGDGSVNDEGMEEIETEVSDFDATAQLFLKIGLVEKHRGEKKRRRWTHDGIVFDIDTYPELVPYLEIEADTWEQVDQGIGLLELDPDEKRIFSATQVYAMSGVDTGKLESFTFDHGLRYRE